MSNVIIDDNKEKNDQSSKINNNIDNKVIIK
jgi:hypothetical protein